MPEKIVLAFSGGLDTTVAVRWLTETRGFDVVALTVDLGSQPNLTSIRERVAALGGTWTAGPTPTGGRVHVELPLVMAATSSP